MRYLKGTIDLGLYYGRDRDYNLHGYTNLDWVGSVVDMKITSGGSYCLMRHIIGSLMYLKNTRPDICFAVNTLI